MESYQIDVIEPEAKQLLKELQDKKLIKMTKLSGKRRPAGHKTAGKHPDPDKFFKTVEKIRNTKAKKPTDKEIEQAVEQVRSEMYEQGKHL